MAMGPLDLFDADRFTAHAGQPMLVVEAARWRRPGLPIESLIVGTDTDATLPSIDPEDFDLLLTSAVDPPAPWASLSALPAIRARVSDRPLATVILAQTLRLTEALSFDAALQVESLAYSTLLGGNEFADWLRRRLAIAPTATPAQPLLITREADRVTLTLNDPAGRNAMTAAMRDALYEALANLIDDPTQPQVTLCGAGACFSTGGDLGEFGSARDLAKAHSVRTAHSCARALSALGDRATVHMHGACIGSGLEVAAAAHRRIAAPGSWFQLPELTMGLIPGAGGSVSVARAIGRHRTAWLLLTGARLRAAQAAAWGLIELAPGR
jgi:hypothetical protein